jgi:hypothetical protein
MKTVYKYELQQIDDYIGLELPEGAQILHFGIQNNRLMIWALVESDNPNKRRIFRMAGTGHSIIEKNPLHIGTVFDGPFVWHLFEVVE